MNHSQAGAAQPVTDAVKRAMEFLKDRPMPQAKTDMRQNFRRGRPANNSAEGSPSPAPGDEHTDGNAGQQTRDGD